MRTSGNTGEGCSDESFGSLPVPSSVRQAFETLGVRSESRLCTNNELGTSNYSGAELAHVKRNRAAND